MIPCYRCLSWPCQCDDGVTLLHADVLDGLRQLPADSVHCVVTSPPYFGLRSYLAADDPLKIKEIGSESTPAAFIATMVEVFREVRRVLRDDGTLFLNLGDSYDAGTAAKRRPSATNGYGKHGYWNNPAIDQRVSAGMVAGNLLNMPHRVAEALGQDGWIWRQTIIWAKRSPMPESVGGWRWMKCRVKMKQLRNNAGTHRDDADVSPVTSNPWAIWADCPGCPKCEPQGGYVLRRGSGRCTTAHEYMFLLAKRGGYFWDGEASKERAHSPPIAAKSSRWQEASGKHVHRRYAMSGQGDGRTSRNPRSVWTLSSEPTSERHFASFASELVRRCLVAGISAGGCCRHCGAPWAPVVESQRVATRPGTDSKVYGAMSPGSPYLDHASIGNRDPQRHETTTRVLAYRPTCDCPPHESGPSTVLDPFCGIGTTGQTAVKLGQCFLGIDLNAKYLDIAAKRIFTPPRWWLRQQKSAKRTRKASSQRPLFAA